MTSEQEPPCLCGHSAEHHKNRDECKADDCSCRRYDADWELVETPETEGDSKP